jgi:hypothetical protein
MRTLLASLVLVSACTAKTPVSDDFSDLAGMDEKSDSFSYRMKVLGTVDYGQTTANATYTKSPRYRAYRFDGFEGDRVDVWVRSSNGGDAVAWLLDSSFHVLASNDDASEDTLDAHIVQTLGAAAKSTHYIVYRDYSLSTAKFSVELAAQPYDTTCSTDADCVAVDRGGCCTDGSLFAVNSSSTDDYAAAVACTANPRPLCPQHIIDDTRVAQCDTSIGRCQMIAPEDIHCGGFIANAHQCPMGYDCQLVVNHPDTGGTCVPSQP